jgi:hypothetical protein
VKFPGNGVQDSRQTILSHAPSEEWIGSECAEGVISNFGVCWRGALSDKIKISLRARWWGIEEDEPDVDTQLRLQHDALR